MIDPVPNIAVHGPTALPNSAFSGRQGARGAEMFAALQDRHVPVTPLLAETLAQMETSKHPSECRPWGQAYELAGQSIGLAQRFGRSARWTGSSTAFRLRVVEPLLRGAAQRLGELRLVGSAPLGTIGGPDPAYELYCRAVEEEVNRMLSGLEVLGEAFWVPVALALFAATLRGRQPHAGSRIIALPDSPDPALARLVYTIPPDFAETDDLRRRMDRPRRRSERLRVGVRPKEGGIDGVIITRRLEDIEDAFHSEFLLPKSYRNLKFFEEGYRIRHRPPLRSPARDLLFLTLCEASPDAGAATLVKAAWIDAAIRLRLALTTMELPLSELGWCDLPTHGPRATAISVQTLKSRVNVDPMAVPHAVMKTQVSDSPLLPNIFERLPATCPRSGEGGETADLKTPQSKAARLLLAACAKATEQTGLRNRETDSAGGLSTNRPEDYGCVFALRVRASTSSSGARITPDWSSERSETIHLFGLDRVASLRCATLLLPPSLTPGAVFPTYLDGGESGDLEIPEDRDPQEAIARTLGLLSHWVITQTLEAVHA